MVSLRWWYTCFHPTLSFASSIGFDLIGSHFYLPLRHYSLYENRIYRNENEKIQKSQRDLSESNKPCFSVNQDNSGITSPKSVEQLALAVGGSPGLWHWPGVTRRAADPNCQTGLCAAFPRRGALVRSHYPGCSHCPASRLQLTRAS